MKLLKFLHIVCNQITLLLKISFIPLKNINQSPFLIKIVEKKLNRKESLEKETSQKEHGV